MVRDDPAAARPPVDPYPRPSPALLGRRQRADSEVGCGPNHTRPAMTDFSVAVHPIALPKPAAAAALGMSVDSFERYVQSDVRCIRRGRMRLYPVAELERWAAENAKRLLSEAA